MFYEYKRLQWGHAIHNTCEIVCLQVRRSQYYTFVAKFSFKNIQYDGLESEYYVTIVTGREAGQLKDRGLIPGSVGIYYQKRSDRSKPHLKNNWGFSPWG